jgi:hypothetical protein
MVYVPRAQSLRSLHHFMYAVPITDGSFNLELDTNWMLDALSDSKMSIQHTHPS